MPIQEFAPITAHSAVAVPMAEPIVPEPENFRFCPDLVSVAVDELTDEELKDLR